MGALDPLKITRKTFFNPSGWLGYDQLKNNSLSLFATIKTLFTIAKPTREETFEEASVRLGLTEADIVESQKTYFLYACVFLSISVLLFVYGFYLLALVEWGAWLLAMTCSSICCAQAFRFHFYYFQIKQRRLGCTFAEWKRDGLFK